MTNDMDKTEYAQDLAIDPHALEDEWMRQPGLYLKYSDMAAQARKERDKASERLTVEKARLDLDIREHPDKYGLPKVTEATVLSAIMLADGYKKANTELSQTTYKMNLLEGAVRALDHKKKALESLVSLWMGTYFSGPKEPKQLKEGKRIVDMVNDQTQDSAVEQAKELHEKRQSETPDGDEKISAPKVRSRTRRQTNA